MVKKNKPRTYIYKDPDTISEARINVNYKGKKPKVKFSYPAGKDKINIWVSCFFIAGMLWILITYLISPLMLWFIITLTDVPHYEELIKDEWGIDIHRNIFNNTGNETQKNKFAYRFNKCKNSYEEKYHQIVGETCFLYAANNSYLYRYDSIELYSFSNAMKHFLKNFIYGFVIPMIFLIILIRVFFGNKIRNKYPTLMVKLHKIAYRKHYRKIFRKVPKEKYLEIPLFKNIWLDYNAKKEFGKYLEEVKIEEHPFDYITYVKKKRKKKRQTYMWRARFYFSKIPKTGYLEVKWK